MNRASKDKLRKEDHYRQRRVKRIGDFARNLGIRVANAELTCEEALKQVREAMNNHPDLQQRLDHFRSRN